MEDEQLFARMVEVLRLLASKPDIQLGCFPSFVHQVDEIALTFDEVMVMISEVAPPGIFNESERDVLDRIDSLLAEMSAEPDKDFWTPVGLRTSATWELIRVMAKGLLDELAIPLERPRIDWYFYVPARKKGDTKETI